MKKEESSEIEIRKLPPAMWEAYKNLRLEALRSDPVAFGSDHSEEAKLNEDTWKSRIGNVLFALDQGRPAGMVGIIYRERIKQRHIADIVGFYVNREYRGRGIGQRLVEEAIAVIRGNDKIEKISLAVNSPQESAMAIYTKFGFEQVGVLRREIRTGNMYYDQILMEKFLKSD